MAGTVSRMNYKLNSIPESSELITNCINDLLNSQDFLNDLSIKICQFMCDSSELYIDNMSKIIFSSIKNIIIIDNKDNNNISYYNQYKISSVIAMYSGGYSWNGDQNNNKLIYEYSDRVCKYTHSCPDGICCMSDININTNDYFCEIIIDGKYDQMWLGITWNPKLAIEQFSWSIPYNKNCITYYGGKYRSNDKGYIQSEGRRMHTNLSRYDESDIIGIKVINLQYVKFYKNNENVLDDDVQISLPNKDNHDKTNNEKYWIFVMLDDMGDSVTFRRVR